MRCYTAHRRDTGLFTEPETVLVKEGFSWPAFFLTFVWALWHRMWLAAAVMLLVELAAGVATELLVLAEPGGTLLTLGIMIFIGFGANDWRRRSLERKGCDEVGIVCGRNRDEAEFRLLQVEASGGTT